MDKTIDALIDYQDLSGYVAGYERPYVKERTQSSGDFHADIYVFFAKQDDRSAARD